MGVELKRRRGLWGLEESLTELAELARSARAIVVATVTQRMDRPTQTYLGKGKLEELKGLLYAKRASTVICDDELTPTQQRNLEKELGGAKVIDRTALILDVFAQRARTKDGRPAGGVSAARISAAEACWTVDAPGASWVVA